MRPDYIAIDRDRVTSRLGCHPKGNFGAFAGEMAQVGHLPRMAAAPVMRKQLVTCADGVSLGKAMQVFSSDKELGMEYRNDAALDFLAARRSHPPRLMAGPAPDRVQMTELLTLAARVPDHGKLEPWRFAVLEREALDRLQPRLRQAVLDNGQDEAAADKAASAFASPVIVVVISSPVPSAKIPQWEQLLSAGAVCLGLVNAALASGWAAAWLTGFAAANEVFAQQYLGLQDGEKIAGLVHIGSRGAIPPERPRPDIDAKTSWLE